MKWFFKFQSEGVIFECEVSRVNKNLITRMKKKLAPLRAKNDVTHAVQLKLQERMNKRQI